MDGLQLIPTPAEDGILAIQGIDIYQLVCRPSACQWIEKRRKLRFPRENFVAFYLSEEEASCSEY